MKFQQQQQPQQPHYPYMYYMSVELIYPMPPCRLFLAMRLKPPLSNSSHSIIIWFQSSWLFFFFYVFLLCVVVCVCLIRPIRLAHHMSVRWFRTAVWLSISSQGRALLSVDVEIPRLWRYFSIHRLPWVNAHRFLNPKSTSEQNECFFFIPFERDRRNRTHIFSLSLFLIATFCR